jgi:serine/threonine protein kinase
MWPHSMDLDSQKMHKDDSVELEQIHGSNPNYSYYRNDTNLIRELRWEQDIVQRLEIQERESHWSKLSHSNIDPILDLEADSDVIRVMTKYHQNGDLYQYIMNNSNLEMSKRISLLIQIGQALHAIHQAGTYHGDLNPFTIFIGIFYCDSYSR